MYDNNLTGTYDTLQRFDILYLPGCQIRRYSCCRYLYSWFEINHFAN